MPATQQIGLALRVVSGLSVKQIARAFLVGEAAMEQRITRAKRRIAEADVPIEAPGATERATRLAAIAAMIYLVFNDGYSVSDQIQAAIAALHARAAKPAETDWAQIDLLYAALEELQPSPVVTLNRAVAVSKVRGPEAALAMVEPLESRLAGYFHFHGLLGALLQTLGRGREARDAFSRANALANSPAEAAHIRMHLDRLMQESDATTADKAAK